MLPLPVVGVSVFIHHEASAVLKAIVEVAFVSVPITGNVNAFPMDFIRLPLPVVNRSIWVKHFASARFLVLIPFPVVNRTILVVINAVTVSHDLAHILRAIKVMQLV